MNIRPKKYDKFCSSLLTVLENCLSPCLSTEGPCRSKSVRREKLWTHFHDLSVRELPKLWCGQVNQRCLKRRLFQQVLEVLGAEVLLSWSTNMFQHFMVFIVFWKSTDPRFCPSHCNLYHKHRCM